MHSAPPVRITLAHEPVWSACVTACAAGAAANLAAWAALQVQAPVAAAGHVALLGAALAAGLAWWALRRSALVPSVLAWDGVAWNWVRDRHGSVPGDVRVMIDLGAWMLLRFMPEPALSAPAWLPVSRRQAGALWPQWRAALFSRRPDAASAATADRA